VRWLDEASEFVFNRDCGNVGVTGTITPCRRRGLGEPVNGPVTAGSSMTVAASRGQAVDADLVVDQTVAGHCVRAIKTAWMPACAW
jgi:hypothetical protein